MISINRGKTTLIKDSELKLNHIYWAEIIDTDLTDLCGKEIQVKFTGIAFRNVKYKDCLNIDYTDDPKEAVRNKLISSQIINDKKDAILFLSQIKLFREVSQEKI
jgi:hypothetical protein